MMIKINIAAFTPYSALIGGLLIGLASAVLILGIGCIAGISGIAATVIKPDTYTDGLPWQLSFLLGMITSAWIVLLFMPFPQINISNNMLLVIFAGLLVGFGTRLGSGCTSGHGVCGLSRLSYRSLTATLIFMSIGFVTVYIMRHLFS